MGVMSDGSRSGTKGSGRHRSESIRVLKRRLEGGARPAAARLTRAEERRLVAAARQGDSRALSRLLELLSGPVYRFGRGFCNDPHDAEDVAQVTLAALARTLRDFRGESSLTTWAYTVARNACTRHRRRSAHAPAHLESLDDPGAGVAARQVADPAADPQRALERAELRAALERAIRSLPPSQRAVLTLRDVEGLSAKEAGDVLGLGERAVKSRLHRARVALREMLAPFAVPGPPETRPAADAHPGRCPDTVRLVSRFLEGELDAAACAKLEAHVRSCPECRGACDTLRGALVSCRAWRGERLPEEIRTTLKQAIRMVVAEARGAR